MVFWILATIVTLCALATLVYAVRGDRVNAQGNTADAAERAHYRAQLAEIEADAAAGRIQPAEAEAAKGELAREYMRLEGETATRMPVPGRLLHHAGFLACLGIAAIAFGVYALIGNPHLPAMPLAERTPPQAASDMDLDQAVARVEAQLAQNPDDARGWSVLGPIYMRMERYDDAVTAYRKVLELLPPTADAETDLAEALMMANNGSAQGEAMALLESAAARDPDHVRSRFYLAGEATRAGNYEEALERWRNLLALGTGEEPWIAVAERGVEAAEAGMEGEPLPPPPGMPGAGEAPETADIPEADQQEMIRGMVEGLSERLTAEGGSLEEWTRLVRSRLVLGERDKAQAAYDAAKKAYPDADRAALEELAMNAGLE